MQKKFDEFYLPCSNSYIIYECQREAGDNCLVVLTGKGEGGVEDRFVRTHYHLLYTEDGVLTGLMLKAFVWHREKAVRTRITSGR